MSYTSYVSDYLKLSNAESDSHRIGETVRKIENHGATMWQ